MRPASNLERKASRSRRKTQTKLTFDPVSTENNSSSPATATTMSPARARYQLPTPARSSQTLGTRTSSGRDMAFLHSANNDGDLSAFSPRSSRDNLYSAMSDEDDALIARIHKKKAKRAPGAFRSLSDKPKQKQKQAQLSDSDLSEPDENNRDEDDNEVDNEEDSEDELSLLTPKPKQRSWANAHLSQSPSKQEPADLDESEEEEPVASGSRRRSRPMLVIPDNEDDDLPVLPKSKETAPNIKRSEAHRGSEIIELSSDDDDSDAVGLSPINRRYSRTIIESESDQEAVSSPLKRRREVAESDESDIVASPTKRSRPTLIMDENDSESDISRSKPRARKPHPEMGTSPVTPSRVTRQARAPRKQHRTAKQKAAELLRRKRAGEKIEKLTDSSSSDDDDGGALYDSDPEHHVLQHFSDEESDPETLREPEPPHRASSQNEEGGAEEGEDAEDDEDEENPKWVVNDGTDYRLGVPDLPLQFSRRSLRPLKENFEDCVEWLVRKRLDPDFSGRDDERFSHAFIKVDDEARGYATSSFLSSQWTAEFTASVKARPVLTMRNVEDGEGITAEGVPKCDACNHRKHPPKYALSFRGQPYVKKTLEDVDQDSDYEDGDEDYCPVDEDGNELEPASREWFSGRDCSDKAFQAHKLIHWKYSLNEAVAEILQSGGHMTRRRIAQRDASSAEDREAYADEVVQTWIDDGTIHSLYREFKEMMETARAYEPRRYR